MLSSAMSSGCQPMQQSDSVFQSDPDVETAERRAADAAAHRLSGDDDADDWQQQLPHNLTQSSGFNSLHSTTGDLQQDQLGCYSHQGSVESNPITNVHIHSPGNYMQFGYSNSQLRSVSSVMHATSMPAMPHLESLFML